MIKVLVACEFSGVVREAFRKQGFDAWSSDLLETEIPGQHIQGDVLPLLEKDWDLVIAHPPCTYLCNSGARWLYSKDGSPDRERWENMRKAAAFFSAFLNCRVRRLVIENPVMHYHAKKLIGVHQSQSIQPWQFGHGETKRTCLWIRGLPILEPAEIVSGREPRLHKLPPSANRGRLRSMTYPGIAKAFADQWGRVLRQEVKS